MTTDDLPEAVRQLVNRHLPSMDHVEILMLLHREPDAAHAVSGVAHASRLDERVAERALEDLASAGLLAVTDDGYRYKPSVDTRDAIAQLVQMYNTRPVTLVRAIYARPSPIKSFGDAFRIRPNEES